MLAVMPVKSGLRSYGGLLSTVFCTQPVAQAYKCCINKVKNNNFSCRDFGSKIRTHKEKSRQQLHNYLTTTKSWFKATDNLAKVASVKLC